MKVVGILFVFVSLTGIGMYASFELKRRKRQLLELKRGLTSLEREIDYQVFSLSEAFLHTADRAQKPWKEFFLGVGQQLKSETGTRMGIRALIEKEVLLAKGKHPWKDDLTVLSSLGNGLGDLDKKMQLLQIQGAKEETQKRILEAEEEEKQKGRLYQSLGVLMGILGVILFL